MNNGLYYVVVSDKQTNAELRRMGPTSNRRANVLSIAAMTNRDLRNHSIDVVSQNEVDIDRGFAR